jgi:hypothetical protein
VCLQPHTSDDFYEDLTFFDPVAGALPRWEIMIDGKTWRGAWAPATTYFPGNIVLYEGQVYLALTYNVSGSSLNPVNWSVLATAEEWSSVWTTNTLYGTGSLVKYGGIVYRSILSHTSAATAVLGLEADQSKWQEVFVGIDYKGAWSSSSVRYKLNDVVTNGADLWIATEGHVSTALFDQTVWELWLPGVDFRTTWVSSAVYQPGDTVTYGGYSYISQTANNQDNNPSTESGAVDSPWALLTQGYTTEGEWNSGISYEIGNVVTRGGNLFVAIVDNASQDPVDTSVTVAYDDGASSGTTLVVDDTSALVPGMILLGLNFTEGPTISEIVDATTLIVSALPVANFENTLTFVGVNTANWELLVPGVEWKSTWTDETTYTIGDIAVWRNGTYRCIQNHTAEPELRPDLDVTAQYWTIYLLHDRRNATEKAGDMPIYSEEAGSVVALEIGTDDYNLKYLDGVTTWREILVIDKVYYVTVKGIDAPGYGESIDKPFRSIKYACERIIRGDLFPEAAFLLDQNKDFLAVQVYEWMLDQAENDQAPFSSSEEINEASTKRDIRYIVDALSYDLARGGNSQTVAATLAYFSLRNNDTFINAEVDTQMPQFLAALNRFRNILVDVANNNSYTGINYQVQNRQWSSSVAYETDTVVYYDDLWYNSIADSTNVEPGVTVDWELSWEVTDEPIDIEQQYTHNVSPETAAPSVALSLFDEILYDALVNVSKRNIPPPNLKTTATIFVKTGTYDEQLPIVVPANTAIVGDELRSTVVRPADAFYTETYSSSVVTNKFTLASTEGVLVGQPVQFVGNRAFGGITIGQTYWVYSVDSTGITISATEDLAAELSIVTGIGSMKVFGGGCLKDMFYFQNGSGLRNLTVTGLAGTLTELNEYFTRRPTGGAYTSLDPGRGPDDTRAWIYRRSPYIQNITTFGQGCVGCKIDGTLHNGGNRSMVSNDFTHILSDGIGVWCTGGDALTEAVSVFSYYNYCGYLAEDGGRIRATNGNSSYGTYGVIAEGFVEDEVPIQGTVFNRSAQIQASVQSSFGSNAQLVKVQYSNAGSDYTTQTTNLIRYSNDYNDSSVWTSDGNLTLARNQVAPNGDSIAWTLNGLTSGTDTAYIYQNNTILPTGATYTSVSGTNISGSGIGATFNIEVTATAYIVTVASGGSGYVVNNQILVPGLILGGVSGVNDCIIQVQSLAGSIITGVTASGTVPSGSTTNYVFSIHCKQLSASSIDLFAIFSGNNTKASGITFDFATETITEFSSTGAGNVPSDSGFIDLDDGWYRVWFVVNDADGLNNNLQYRIYPRGQSGNTGSTIVYGSQMTIGTSLTFYLATKNTRYTAYADYYITGAGINAVAIGDEIRSGTIFQTRVLDTGLGVGGRRYLTASNNGQDGTPFSITLAGSDINTASNYIGMRVFVNSGVGAGQYAVISDFSELTKVAKVIKETYDPLTVESSDSTSDEFTVAAGSTLDSLYVGQPVQFTPTYYTTSVTASSIATVTVEDVLGGVDSQMVIEDTRILSADMPITFSGAVFGGVTAGFTYYVKEIISVTNFTISTQPSGNLLALNSGTGSMTLEYPSGTGYLTGDTANMEVNFPISFTGATIGSVTSNQVYYINEIIDESNFTISDTLLTLIASGTNAGTGNVSLDTTLGLSELNPIVFTGTGFGGIVPKQKYYISRIIDGTIIRITENLISVTATATAAVSNLITVNSTAGFIANNPIKFTGNTFGNLVSETAYYILAVNDGTTFTVSTTPGGSAFPLSDAVGIVSAKTPTANFAVTTDVGSMTVKSTVAKEITTKAVGTMVGTFYTNLFGNASRGNQYYIRSIGTNSFSVEETLGSGIVLPLVSETGSMQLAESGWDHINPGTPIEDSLTSSSVYFIEPRIIYEAPPFEQEITGDLPTLLPGTTWSSMAFGNGYWIAFPENNTTAARTEDGITWTQLTLPTNETWADIAFGNNYWIAIGNQGGDVNSKALYSSSNGNGWRSVDLPGNRGWTRIVYGNGKFVIVAAYVPEDVLGGIPAVNAAAGYSTNFGGSWSAGTGLPTTENWVGLCYGAGIFSAVSTGGQIAISTDGIAWTSYTAPAPGSGTFEPSDIAYGNGRFVAVTGGKTLYSLTGYAWYLSNLEITADKISYGQGIFVAIDSASGDAWISDDGFSWKIKTIDALNYKTIQFGIRTSNNKGTFITIADDNTSSSIFAGSTAKARANVVSGTIPTISHWETGSNYELEPTVAIFDPNIAIAAEVQARIGVGALGNPSWVNRGEGYNTNSTQIKISGDGYADQYQTGFTLITNNLTKLPSPGDNLQIENNPIVYKVTSAVAKFGTVAPNLEANIQVSPELLVSNSPAHNTALTIRQKYSQVRLTNHDFLSIGFGNEEQTNYPNPPEDTILAPQDQTVETNNGRVFYTSSDQDGNFKVGNLFAVEQATGIITISATQFGLSGLDELRLGGIAVGGSSVIIRQFSTDPTFVANSNEILPTQKAIKAYLSSRLSQGGSNTFTGELTAGTVKVGGPDKIQSTVPAGIVGHAVKIPVRASFQGQFAAVDGDAMALAYFMKTFWRR